MVERGDVAGDREHRVGQAEIVGRHVGEPLDLAHDVVPEVADDTTVERRQVVELRGAVGGEQGFERGERTLVGGDSRAAARGRTRPSARARSW